MTFLESIVQYQEDTAYHRDSMSGGSLDWSNQPATNKRYPDAQATALPRELVLPRIEAWRALIGRVERPGEPLSLPLLANLLFMAYGFTARTDYGAQVFHYRSAPSAGALYPAEIYLTARDVQGLADGLYHYNIEDFSLDLLWSGTPPAFVPAPALFLTAIYFRSAWKYRDRAFRYCLLDIGHLSENIRLISPSLGLTADWETQFDDEGLNAFLGLDPDRERLLSLFRLGANPEPDRALHPAPAAQVPTGEPCAPREMIPEPVALAGRLTAQPFSQTPDLEAEPEPLPAKPIPLPRPASDDLAGPSLVQALQNRRSRRNFKPQTLNPDDLSKALTLIAPAGTLGPVHLGLVTSSLVDLSDGHYRYRPERHDLVLQKGGFISPALGRAALNQEWAGRAGLVLVISAPLKALEQRLGPRALRLAYMTAGRIGQRAYLAAEVLGWGCCGIGAFFDLELQQTLGLPDEESALYLVSLGPYKQRTHGGRPQET